MDYSKLLEQANMSILDIPAGQVFFAKDLFPGTEWNQLQTGERLSFGRRFKNAVMDGRFPGVVYVGKADNNSAQYQKESVN